MKSLLDPTFRYTKAIDTDLRKTFARIRAENAKAKAAQHNNAASGSIASPGRSLASVDQSGTVALHPHKRNAA